jgi:hypothetical protein
MLLHKIARMVAMLVTLMPRKLKRTKFGWILFTYELTNGVSVSECILPNGRVLSE